MRLGAWNLGMRLGAWNLGMGLGAWNLGMGLGAWNLGMRLGAWNLGMRLGAWNLEMRLLIQYYLPGPSFTHTGMSSLPFGSSPRPWAPYSMLAWHRFLCLSLMNSSSTWS